MTILQVGCWTVTSTKWSHNCNVLCSPGWGAGHAGVCRAPKTQGWCKEVPRPGMIRELEKEHHWKFRLCFRTILACILASLIRLLKNSWNPILLWENIFWNWREVVMVVCTLIKNFCFRILCITFKVPLTWINTLLQRPAFTRDFATQRAAYAAERSTLEGSFPEKAPPPWAPQPPYVSTMIFWPVSPASDWRTKN